MDFRASTPTITAADHGIVGAKDPATLPEYGEEIHKMIKGSKIVSLEAAHLSNIGSPRPIRGVLKFFDGTEDLRPSRPGPRETAAASCGLLDEKKRAKCDDGEARS